MLVTALFAFFVVHHGMITTNNPNKNSDKTIETILIKNPKLNYIDTVEGFLNPGVLVLYHILSLLQQTA